MGKECSASGGIIGPIQRTAAQEANAKIEYAQITHINVINANKCMHYTAGCLYRAYKKNTQHLIF